MSHTEKKQTDIVALATGIASGCASFVQHIDNSRVDDHPILDEWDYDHAEELYDRIAGILNGSGLALHAKAYVVAQLGNFAMSRSEEDIPLTEEL